jgi:hypothetical protein
MCGRGRVFVALLGFGLGAACTGHDGSDRGVEPTEPPVEQGKPGADEAKDPPVIVTLETRQHVISIHVDGEQGREFTVATLDGRVLASRVTLVQLRRDFPKLHEAVESSIADLDCSGPDCPVLDASAHQVLDASLR